jgi:putative peptidoglycan lipid II flippase
VNFWVNIALASGMQEGSVSALDRAWKLFLLPQGVIAQSAANAVFPTFSYHAAQGDTAALSRIMGQVLRAVLFLALPAMVGLIILRLPIVRILYERGEFTYTDSLATSWALLFYALGLVSHSLVEIVTRAFYALHDTRTPVLVGGVAMVLNVGLSFGLIHVVGTWGVLAHGPFAGLALANTLATTLEGLALLALITPRVGGFEGRRTAVGLLKVGAASAGMGVAIWAMGPLVENLGKYAGPLLAIATGGAIFYALAWALRSEEARLFTTLLLQRLGRARVG